MSILFDPSYRVHGNMVSPCLADYSVSTLGLNYAPPHSSHPAFGHLILLVFEAVLEVVCVSAPGYIIARQGGFSAEMQKFVANLNVALFTPCLIFTKLASQLTPGKLAELAVIPAIFVVQTLVSYLCSVLVSRMFGFKKRPQNFVIAMGVFGNSNSLPISLVISLSQTLKGLHWDKIPGDNDDEVAARGILYLLIFQQLGQLVRWSWGYHVLLAPPDKFDDEDQYTSARIEQGEGRYRDESDSEGEEEEDDDVPLLEDDADSDPALTPARLSPGRENGSKRPHDSPRTESEFASGEETPVTRAPYTSSVSSVKSTGKDLSNGQGPVLSTPAQGNMLPTDGSNRHITSFPSITSPAAREGEDPFEEGITWQARINRRVRHALRTAQQGVRGAGLRSFQALPPSIQGFLKTTGWVLWRFGAGFWDFMNPPLWAMLAAIIVASIPALQQLFFTQDSFIQNSVTRAVSQSGGVAVPLILVVLGANLARNTLPAEARHPSEDDQLETRLLIASIVSRMLLPTIVMAPLLALAAKYIPISILDDPIFVIVCFLLTGAPSALQLAQICQINGVYEGVMSRLLFQSYVIWILPSTLVLVMCALEVVEWANGG
ncbi:MAG: hypothetical protein M1838_000355 [Thelocarpon superellum]|nr:MAG: hypothetical protein M1838_000355 [Thelocarpon superellum]